MACASLVAAPRPWISRYLSSFMTMHFSPRLMHVNSPKLIVMVSQKLNTHPTMQTVEVTRREKLAILIRESGSQSALSEKIDKAPAQISQWLNASINSKTGKPRVMSNAIAREIELKIGKPQGWMDQPITAFLTAQGATDHRNTSPGPALRGKVPLISWIQAGAWCTATDPHPPGVAERWLDCPVNHSKGTFALRVRGDSMTAPHGNTRTYPEGCFIFVDPERRTPDNGERVVACLSGSDEVTFKIYKNEDGRQWLQPLNPSHEPIRENFHILGTVLGKWEDG